MLETQSGSVIGTWYGALEVGNGVVLPVVFVFSDAGGVLCGTMQSPAQSPRLYECAGLSLLEDGKFSVQVPTLQIQFDGFLKRSDKEPAVREQTLLIDGTFAQGAATFPLQLTRTDEFKPPHRPQEPVGPFPYVEEHVSFASGSETLDGTLTIPSISSASSISSTRGRFPAAILLSGSGPQDRDEQILFHKPLKVLADYLTRHGIAVLRYDKRGVAKSTGDYRRATTADFADDALAALSFLQGHEQIDRANVGFIGHSEGGIIAPMSAAKSDQVRFIVSLAGSTIPGDQLLISQTELLARVGGGDETKIAESLERARRSYEILKAEPDNQTAIEKITALRKTSMGEGSDGCASEVATKSDGVLEMQMQFIVSPWFRFFVSHDPCQSWAKVRCPVLAVYGEKDVQVDADLNMAALEKASQANRSMTLTQKKLPGLNHLFQNCSTGSPLEYGLIEETMSPLVLDLVEEWIAKELKTTA